MPNVATKLFREPGEAREAVSQLKAKGFKDNEIVVVASKSRVNELGADVKATPDMKKLADLGLSEEAADYYQYSIPLGGIVVGVSADEGRLAQAKEALRAVPVCSCSDRICDTSPGFRLASRMTATNPIDAPMSGDFRKY